MGVLQRLGLTYFVVAVLETISATSTDVHLVSGLRNICHLELCFLSISQ